MKIAWIRIKGFQQFEDTFIDFRHPETGEPLDKVCLIGRNGTGKSTVLDIIRSIILSTQTVPGGLRIISDALIALKFNIDDKWYIACGIQWHEVYTADIENEKNWFENYWKTKETHNSHSHSVSKIPYTEYYSKYVAPTVNYKFDIEEKNKSVLIYCPSETSTNPLLEISDVPTATLNEALAFYSADIPYYHNVSNQSVQSYWLLLIYLIKKRESDRDEFENSPENLTKTKLQLKDEFEKNNPDILKDIADLWNIILSKAKMKFDYLSAKKPIQLTENLKAYIVDDKGRSIAYNRLSTGIRNFIFRFGHIKTLYFNRTIKNGLLLVDEPENSLFPDFLLNIIEQYEKVTTDKNGERNTQMFFATHSPIIASQFEPHERIILEWDENGSVTATKGVSPVGDDPNDILYQDFKMTEIVSRKGQEVWKAYLDLKKKLGREKDDAKKKEIAEEILRIGREYKFE